MSSEPSYPKDEKVGEKPRLNETLSHALTAKEAETRAAEAKAEEEASDKKGSTRSFVRGAAVGVGSAALVAALLYARRSGRDKDKG